MIYAGTKGWADTVPVAEVQRFELELKEFFRAHHADLLEQIRTKGTLPDTDAIDAALKSFLDGFDTGKVD